QGPQALFGEFRNRQTTKLAGRLAGIQKKAQVGGRNACRDGGRFFLHIIRDQPVVFLGTELGEIAPGAKRRPLQKQFVLVGSFAAQGPRRQVQPHRNPLAAAPQQQDGQRGKK